MQDLQINTLIGMTTERGNAWHRRDDLRRLPDGTMLEDNHYPGFIPVADVQRRLFSWLPESLPVAYLKPCSIEEADIITADGTAVKVIESQAGRKGLLRDDNAYDLGIFKTAVHQPYSISLIREAERLTGSTLGVSSAGLLALGGRAWVEFSLPQTFHDALSGFSYRPNLLKADSMDGTMAHTTCRTVNATVCDNTLDMNLFDAKRDGAIFRRRHTAGYGNLQDERDALGILEATNEQFVAALHALIQREITPKQVIQVMDIIMPVPEDEGRGKTRMENRRELWLNTYNADPMCATWKGTAFGVLQTDNTVRHWYSQVSSGVSRSERNTTRAIQGESALADQQVVRAVETVLA